MIQFQDILTLLEQQLELHSLTTIQVSVLQLTWEGKGYAQMAEQLGYDPDYVKGVGANLWQILSEKINSKVTKRNVRYLLDNYYQNIQNKQKKSSLTQQDWGDAIDVSIFYNREKELKKLIQWIIKDKCRIVGILGMGGIGKTVLGIKLGKQIQDHFDYLIWRSLNNAPPYNFILGNLATFFSDNQSTEFKTRGILHYLRKYRCLIILDNLDSILQDKKQGQFKQGYEKYEQLLNVIAETEHKSCLILTSREKIATTFNSVNDPSKVKILFLQPSLDITHPFLKTKYPNTKDDLIIKLSKKYDHHPLSIKLIANSIQDLFSGNIEIFLKQKKPFFNNSIHKIAVQRFEQLNTLEQQIVFWLTINRTWTTIEQLKQDIYPPVSFAQVIENIEYLVNRHLIQIKLGKYQHHPLTTEYFTERIIEQFSQEILSSSPHQISIINKYPMVKNNVEIHIKQTQKDLIMKPIAQAIKDTLIMPKAIKKHILSLIKECQNRKIRGYAIGNLLNLCQELSIDLTGQTFCGLTIWHTDLQQNNLQGASFYDCHFYPPLENYNK